MPWSLCWSLVSFVVLTLWKDLRVILNLLAFYLLYRSVPPLDDPSYTNKDVTVIIPTIGGDSDELRATIGSIIRAEPQKIIVVTIEKNFQRARAMAAALGSPNINVYSIKQANKRHQLLRGLREVKTEITVLADDDVTWPETILPWMLAPFEDQAMGGVGTNQQLRREANPNMWNFLGAHYLLRRNFDCTACTYWDGGLPCLSGRTVAYRTHILQDRGFCYGFEHERWGNNVLNADDDNFITRWLVSHGYKTFIQFDKDCEVRTTLEDNPKYLQQCLRWARSNWRSNITSMFIEGQVWRRHPYSCYAVFLTTLIQWSIVSDAARIWLCYVLAAAYFPEKLWLIFVPYAIWVVFLSRAVKFSGHWVRYPEDLIYVPFLPVIGYAHIIIKLKAMFTLKETTWGSRAGADEDDRYRMVPLPPYVDPPTEAEGSAPRYRRFEASHRYASGDEKSPLLYAADNGSATAGIYHDGFSESRG